jgi:hypothetical protein
VPGEPESSLPFHDALKTRKSKPVNAKPLIINSRAFSVACWIVAWLELVKGGELLDGQFGTTDLVSQYAASLTPAML